MLEKVAIVGASFRFPGTSTTGFWKDLLAGRDFVTQVDPARWALDTFRHENKSHPGTSYTFAAGSLGDVAGFDAGFFGISPREAALMDPQQRLLLELTWEALENAGVRPSSIRGSNCAVFIGIASADYSHRFADDLAAIDASFATGNTASIAANRLSYVFDLRGPSMAIDTACSSSLVAFHQAVRSVQSGESSQALVGGVSLHLHPTGFISFSKASMLSRQGRCRVFDASGDGYVRSEGGGIFFIKNYEQALADGNSILAVVSHTAVNTDGRKSGLTVPSARAQAELLVGAYAAAGIAPDEIAYIEAHGTGTAVGDPIETRALGESLGQRRARTRPLPIGSVKSNMGHLEAASGVAGLMKALYCVRHRQVPGTIGVATPNPNIRLDDWNLEVVTANLQLPPTGRLVVGVNSFGFGGANAHVILESHAERAPSVPSLPRNTPVPVLVSGRDPAALRAAAMAMADTLAGQRPADLYDMAYQSVLGRDWHEHRALVYASDPGAIASALRQFADDETPDSAAAEGRSIPDPLPAVEVGAGIAGAMGPAFVYTGNGSQWAGMGRRLLADPIFRQAVREVDGHFSQYSELSLEAQLLDDREGLYEHTEIAQPALFALQVGITRMLLHRGLVPVAVAGHSVGEVAAAWAAGALTLAAAVEVIFQRSRLQGHTKGAGAMTAVGLGAAVITQLLEEHGLAHRLTIAGINSSKGVTIAGAAMDLDRLEGVLHDREVFYRRLDLDYAFHSAAMEPIAAELRACLAHLAPGETVLPFHSTVTGGQLAGKELGANYWWRNVRRPVLFEPAIKGMVADGINIFIEIGPHSLLRGYVTECLKDAGVTGRIIATAKRGDDTPARIAASAAQAMLCGATVDWQRTFPWRGQPVQLPNYPWQREHCWHPVTGSSLGVLYREKAHPLLGYPLAQHALTWENTLDTLSHPLLADHVVGDATVFPASGFAELALAAAFLWQPGNCAEIEDLEISAPLLLSADRSRVLRLAIDPADGGFVISTRDQQGSEAWTVHAVGRILREPRDLRLQADLTAVPDALPDFTSAGHAALTTAAGLRYGPAFQAIDHGWAAGDRALAMLRIPPAVQAELAGQHLHPALLDCTFQLIIWLLRDELGAYKGMTFVPTRIGHLSVRRGAEGGTDGGSEGGTHDRAGNSSDSGAPGSSGVPCYARAHLRTRGPHSLSADYEIFDASLRMLARVEGVRLRGMRLAGAASDALRFLDTVAVPRPQAASELSVPALAPAAIDAAMQENFRRAVLKGTHRRYTEEVDPLLDSLCSRFAVEALRTLPPAALRGVAAAPGAQPYLRHLMDLATEDGAFDAVDARASVRPAVDSETAAQDIWNALVADYPDYFPIFHAVGRVGMHLPQLLDGSTTLVQTLPREASLPALMGQVLCAGPRIRIGRKLGELLRSALAQLAPGQRLCALEISDGPSVFCADLARGLDLDRVDLVFASTRAETVAEARRLQEKYPAIALETIVAGETRGADAQAPAQLVIVTLDFLALDDAQVALAYARGRLASGGSLIVLGQHPARWADFVFGADPRWWGTHWPQGSAVATRITRQVPAEYWQQQLQSLGLDFVSMQEFSPGTASGPFMMLAGLAAPEAPAVPVPAPPAQRWLVLGDAHVPAHALVRGLEELGQQVVLAEAGSAAEMDTALRATRTQLGGIDGVVFVGPDGRRGVRAPPAAHFAALERCTTASALAQACERALAQGAPPLTCWLVTDGALRYLLPSGGPQEHADPGVDTSGEAALLGLGRSLLNEAAGYGVRLVDLQDAANPSCMAALASELVAGDTEREVILTATGARYATRLRLQERPVAHRLAKGTAEGIATVSAEGVATVAAKGDARGMTAGAKTEARTTAGTTHRLGFTQPGQLRNLQWVSVPRRDPAHDEVEVHVRATGLNFRDVMYTLGLLSDEAIETGFGGPSIGLEFSGIVVRAGAGASAFAPGDHVVGFGPSSFADRVITRASALARLPSGMSFEAGATIPSTFFTAYYALHHLARLQPGEKVLIHGAAGGVGIAAIQLAKWCGAQIFATAGSDEKRDFLHMLGVDQVFDSRSLAYADQILAVTGGLGVDVVVNSLAGEAINRNFRVLRPFGRFLELGKRDFYENTRIGLRPFRNNISYFGIDADQLMNAQPELTQRLFGEVMALFHAGALHPLPYRSFEAEDVVDAFRYMQQARKIGKIVVTYGKGIPATPAAQPVQRLELPADASYLVTGGLTGFGLRTAQWLVERGARHLVLLSRSGPAAPEAQDAIAQLHSQGVQVLARACDVTDRAALQAILLDAAATLPPLRGVVHSAVVIDDGLLRNASATQFERVLAPKVLGARHLDALTRALPLDFFVLYSSATTLFGNPGQGAYVAANTALEALARQRRAQGLPATSVLWGAIDDVGFLARNSQIKDALQSRMGGTPLTSITALAVLEAMLVSGQSGLGVLPLDWRALSRFLPSAASPRFAELARDLGGAAGEIDSEGGVDIRRLLAELPDSELAAAFSAMLRQEVGDILRVAPEKIDESRSIYEMGLDSLMGVELVVALESRFGVRLPVMAISESPTIEKLAARILVQLKGEAGGRGDGASPGQAPAAGALPESPEPGDATRAQIQLLASQHAIVVTTEEVERIAKDVLEAGGPQPAQRMIR